MYRVEGYCLGGKGDYMEEHLEYNRLRACSMLYGAPTP